MDKPRAVVAAGKRFFYRQLERRWRRPTRTRARSSPRNMLGEDAQEGVGAFVEKRKPRWERA